MIIFFITLGGFLFSGYLSLIKFLSNTCALNEPCPYFLNYPACWYGFGLFSILFISSIITQCNKKYIHYIYWIQIIVSGIGILFAAYFTWPEVIQFLGGNSSYRLGLPTCAYGLIFYILVFILVIRKVKAKPGKE
jgi:hypothetical protein